MSISFRDILVVLVMWSLAIEGVSFFPTLVIGMLEAPCSTPRPADRVGFSWVSNRLLAGRLRRMTVLAWGVIAATVVIFFWGLIAILGYLLKPVLEDDRAASSFIVCLLGTWLGFLAWALHQVGLFR